MSGIAELLANLGYDVSGSDAKTSDVTDRLESLGVAVAYDDLTLAHHEPQLRGAVVLHVGDDTVHVGDYLRERAHGEADQRDHGVDASGDHYGAPM